MFKEGSLVISTAIYLFQEYLCSRQYRQIVDVKECPAALKTLMDDQEFTKTRAYGIDKLKFGFVENFKSLLIHTAMIYWNVYPLLWNRAGILLSQAVTGGIKDKQWEQWEIWHSLVYITLILIWETILQVPFSLYSTFVVEQRHGFNNQTLGLFFQDLVKTTALSVIIGYPVLVGFLYLVNSTGDVFYWYAWAFFFGVQLVMLTIYPTLIQPLFNKMDPLPAGELKERIEELAKSVKFPLSKLYVIDGSKRSNHSNAYFYGFFKTKHIVLFDTLLKQVEPIEEILAVLAHEIGHWQLSHTVRMLAMSQLQLLSLFFLFSKAHKNWSVYGSFGFGQTPIDSAYIPTVISFQLFLELYSAMDFILSYLMNVITRVFEFQADQYANNLNMGKNLANALLKLSVENRGIMWPDPWYSAWNHSHPPVLERLQAIGVKVSDLDMGAGKRDKSKKTK
eukprot:Partr_v1_DN28521_c1_g1_i1_m73681 putative CAAX prenyl protease